MYLSRSGSRTKSPVAWLDWLDPPPDARSPSLRAARQGRAARRPPRGSATPEALLKLVVKGARDAGILVVTVNANLTLSAITYGRPPTRVYARTCARLRRVLSPIVDTRSCASIAMTSRTPPPGGATQVAGRRSRMCQLAPRCPARCRCRSADASFMPMMVAFLPLAAYLVTIASSVATVETSQMWEPDMSITTFFGSPT